MSKLLNITELNEDTFIDQISNNEVSVYEDIQGSKIYVNYNGREFILKARSLSSDPINMIDLAVQKYYNKAVEYFNSLDIRVKNLLNRKWWFCLEYFPDNQPANLIYNRLPKNSLVLTSIVKNNKYEYTYEEIDEYSRLLNVDTSPMIFKGQLGEKTIEAIKYFLNTSEADLEYVFGEKTFAFFFYKILNPQMTHSFLMDDDFQKNLEKIIIRIENTQSSFQILNPLYKRISDTNNTEFVEVYSLILVNFLTFCQSINMDQIKIKGDKKDDAYIYLICKLFNMYIAETKDDLIEFDFVVPEFFDKEKFRINIELISNKLTKEYIDENPKLEYVFKVIMGSFNRKRKRVIGIFTENTLSIFNAFVDTINSKIDMYLNKRSEIELAKSGLVSFGDFFNIEFDKDGSGNVYPDVYSEFENPQSPNKKGKKKGDKEIGDSFVDYQKKGDY